MITRYTSALPLTQATLLKQSSCSLSLSKLSAHLCSTPFSLVLVHLVSLEHSLLPSRRVPSTLVFSPLRPCSFLLWSQHFWLSLLSLSTVCPHLLHHGALLCFCCHLSYAVLHELQRSTQVNTGRQPRLHKAIDLVWWERWWVCWWASRRVMTSRSRLHHPGSLGWERLGKNRVSGQQQSVNVDPLRMPEVRQDCRCMAS